MHNVESGRAIELQYTIASGTTLLHRRAHKSRFMPSQCLCCGVTASFTIVLTVISLGLVAEGQSVAHYGKLVWISARVVY